MFTHLLIYIDLSRNINGYTKWKTTYNNKSKILHRFEAINYVWCGKRRHSIDGEVVQIWRILVQPVQLVESRVYGISSSIRQKWGAWWAILNQALQTKSSISRSSCHTQVKRWEDRVEPTALLGRQEKASVTKERPKKPTWTAWTTPSRSTSKKPPTEGQRLEIPDGWGT